MDLADPADFAKVVLLLACRITGQSNAGFEQYVDDQPKQFISQTIAMVFTPWKLVHYETHVHSEWSHNEERDNDHRIGKEFRYIQNNNASRYRNAVLNRSFH